MSRHTFSFVCILLISMACATLFAGCKPAKNLSEITVFNRHPGSTEQSQPHKRPRPSGQTEDTTAPDSSGAQEAATETDTPDELVPEQAVYLMTKGDSVKASVTMKPTAWHGTILWSSDHPSVASVSYDGTITAGSDGNAVITCQAGGLTANIYVNVVTNTPDGSKATLDLYREDGTLLHYTLFRQGAHTYQNYDYYMAWHGCATCSACTVVGAYSKSYANITPDEFIDTVEKGAAPPEDWTKQHVTKPKATQMPLSPCGISTIFTFSRIKHELIRTYKKQEARQDIINHLKTGNAVLFEVRKKSNITGQEKKRWTSSVHTMVFLGIYTNGQVLVCDSVNRSWYSGGQRAKRVDLDDPMEYMYSCTSLKEGMYFKSIGSDGGYIKVY